MLSITQFGSGEGYFKRSAGIHLGTWHSCPQAVGTAVVDTAKRRKPNFAAINASNSGRVTHDELGNAVWQWDRDREEANGSIQHLNLSVEDGLGTPNGKINSESGKSVNNPYTSDRIEKGKRGKSRDLRALSRHIAEQRKRAEDKDS